jgi:transcriptional regulator with XRE-family HTH domain
MTMKRKERSLGPPVGDTGLYTRKAIARLLGVTVKTIMRWEKTRGLPSYKVGLNRVIPMLGFLDWCGQHSGIAPDQLTEALMLVPPEERIKITK